MLKSKAAIKRWAMEIVRCENIISEAGSTKLEKKQAMWKIEAIMQLFEEDFEALVLLMQTIEDIFQKDLTK